jgi:MFS family permease
MLKRTLELFGFLFSKNLSRQVRELYASTLILDLAVSMVAIFEPVFLYVFFSQTNDLKGTLEMVVIFYLIVYIIDFFLLPVGAKFAKWFGYENSIAFSTLFHIGFYLSLFSANIFYPAIFLAAIFYACSKSFYWPAYHANFARFSSIGEQGRQICNLYALESIIFITGPLIGGLVLQFFDFKVLFVISSILILASSIPMLITREVFEPKSFAYWDSIKKLFKKENRRRFLAHCGYGEEWIAATIWPIFMFIILSNYLGLGSVSAISTFISTVLLLFIGRLTDKTAKVKILRLGVVLYFFSWLFRIITRGYWSVTLVNIYSRLSKNTISVPVIAGLYQNAQSSSVMGSIMFFEMALVLGKIVAMVLAFLILQFVAPGWNSLFILASLFTLLFLFFKKDL